MNLLSSGWNWILAVCFLQQRLCLGQLDECEPKEKSKYAALGELVSKGIEGAPFVGPVFAKLFSGPFETEDHSNCLQSIRNYIVQRANEAEYKAAVSYRNKTLEDIFDKVILLSTAPLFACRSIQHYSSEYRNSHRVNGINGYSTTNGTSANNKHSSYTEFFKACDRHVPKDALMNIRDMAALPFGSLFESLAKATGYSLELFTKIGMYFLDETRICGELAIQCFRLKYPTESSYREKEIVMNYFANFTEQYVQARQNLLSNFNEYVKQEVEDIAKDPDINRFPTKFMAEKIYNHLTHFYYLRSWVVLVFDTKERGTPPNDILERHNNNTSSFSIANDKFHWVIIVHYANRTKDCTHISKRFQGRRIRDFYMDQLNKYEDITKHKGALSPLLTKIEERLRDATDFIYEHNFALIAIKYSSSLEISTNFDRRYHFFDCLWRQVTYRRKLIDERTYCIVLGWC